MSALYWRLNITAGNSAYVRAIEIEFHSTIGGSTICTGGTAIASTSFSGQPASGAFDGIINNTPINRWTSSGAALPQWIGYQLPTAADVVEIKVCGDTTPPTPSQAILTFTLQSSPDGVTWADAWRPITQVTWPAATFLTFTAPVTAFAGELLTGTTDAYCFSSEARAVRDAGIFAPLINYQFVIPLQFKNQGWYGVGSAYETWLTLLAPDLLPPSGHTLADVQHFPVET